ncbi:MAG: DUF1579 domain-containing protein [Saprospiraceae bacterium]
MKPTTLLSLGPLLLLFACKNHKTDSVDVSIVGDSTAKDTGATNTQPPMEYDSAAMMKAWMDFATPGDMHKWMAKYNGTWNGEVTTWMEKDKPPVKSNATVTNKTTYNGLYQIGTYKGNMMGMPFEGQSILGYDNSKKKFVTTWIDNMGSGIVIMTGDWDEGSKTLHLKGTQTNPMDGTDMIIRQEVKFVDDNTQVTTMYGSHAGAEEKMMEINLKRKM